MYILMWKTMLSFPMVFWFGFNPFQSNSQSVNFKESAEACGNSKKPPSK